jgi:MFS family permease
LASIVVSYGAEDGYQVPMVIIYAVSSCFGRIVFGILSDRYALRVSRATFINTGVLLMGLCQFGFSVATLPYFYPLIVLLGVSYGCIMAVMSAFMSDRFGNKFYGINLSFASISSAAGSYLIGTLLAAHIYEQHIHGTGHLCVGRPCYSMTFLITTGLCMFSFVLGVLLMYRNRKERKRITSPPPNMVSINAIYTEDSLKNVKY